MKDRFLTFCCKAWTPLPGRVPALLPGTWSLYPRIGQPGWGACLQDPSSPAKCQASFLVLGSRGWVIFPLLPWDSPHGSQELQLAIWINDPGLSCEHLHQSCYCLHFILSLLACCHQCIGIQSFLKGKGLVLYCVAKSKVIHMSGGCSVTNLGTRWR